MMESISHRFCSDDRSISCMTMKEEEKSSPSSFTSKNEKTRKKRLFSQQFSWCAQLKIVEEFSSSIRDKSHIYQISLQMKMILLPMLLCLSLNRVVLAPPSLYINHKQSPESVTLFTPLLLNLDSSVAPRPPTTTTNGTKTAITPPPFDLNAYGTSWKFVDKNTIRVRFRLLERFLRGVHSVRFVTRHIHTGLMRTYDQPHERINSTFTLYLHNLKHGRHTVCLLLYSSKSMSNPRHIFCLDVIYNFHKYRHHDAESDDHKDTFFFLLTQYAIVCGIICILQIVHAARKRQALGALYEKANALRQAIMEHHQRPQGPKGPADLARPTHALDFLIYNLDRNALCNFDRAYTQTPTVESTSITTDSPEVTLKQRTKKNYLKPPSRSIENSTPLLNARRPATKNEENTESEDEIATVPIFDESDFDTRSYEDQAISYKSVSHILEDSKPWMTRLTDNGSVKHSLLSSTEPLPSTSRVCNL